MLGGGGGQCSDRTFSVYTSDSIIVVGFIYYLRDGSRTVVRGSLAMARCRRWRLPLVVASGGLVVASGGGLWR